jgi:peroxiredoxin
MSASIPSALLAGLLALAPAGQTVDDFACIDHVGRFQRLSRHADARFVVLFTYGEDCPIVRQNAAELRALMPDFAGRGVRFLGLDASPQDTRATIAAELAELELDLPVLIDDTQCVAEMLGVTRTAEALVIDTRSRDLVWRGPVDDRVGYGGQREGAGRAYLREALEAVLDGRAPDPEVPRAKGCAITFLEPRAEHAVDYVRDVAPILQRRCVPCHREGGVGPWAMTGHERVRGWSAMVRDVLLSKRMTPWNADPLYGEFDDDLDIRAEEVRALVHWIERGAPRGEGEDPLAQPLEAVPEWPLGAPDMIIDLPEQTVPANGIVPYRELALQLENEQDIWVRALDLRPTNARVLHHAFAFLKGQQEIEMLKEHYLLTPVQRFFLRIQCQES